MAKILPAGQHYGATLRSWTSPQLTVSSIFYDSSVSSELHGNERASVMFVQAGHCVKQAGKQIIQLPRSSGLFLPPNYLQQDSFPGDTTFLSAEFSTEFLNRLRDSGSVGDELIRLDEKTSQGLREHLLNELSHPDGLSSLVLEGVLMSTVALSRRNSSARHHLKPPEWLTRAKEVLHDSVSDRPALEDVARFAGIHPAHLSREFRRHFGCTPGEYARRLRVDRAKLKLADSRSPLAEISLELGFTDQAHFSRSFQRYTGTTPLNYRRSAAVHKK
jgi:AraC family transcriptional regulator